MLILAILFVNFEKTFEKFKEKNAPGVS